MKRLYEGCPAYRMIDGIITKYGNLADAPDEAFRPVRDWLGEPNDERPVAMGERVGPIKVEQGDSDGMIEMKKLAADLTKDLRGEKNKAIMKKLCEFGINLVTVKDWTHISLSNPGMRMPAGVKKRRPVTHLAKSKGKTYYCISTRCPQLGIQFDTKTAVVKKRWADLGFALVKLRKPMCFGEIPEGEDYITTSGIFTKGDNADYER